ncbi:MAG: energy transducer TonB [Sphingobacteriaceae bacterium]|nr:energy transducer TonB [Sphingobacteriaceae bacterium]
MKDTPANTEDELNDAEPVYKDRSLLYMGIILGVIILVMGYLTLFVDDPSNLFKKEADLRLAPPDKTSILNENESMSDEQVQTTLIKFIEAFYYDQRRGYFDPPSYFADITETFYNYHNLTHKRVKEIYWRKLEGLHNFKRNWIVSTLDFERVDSRITASYWAKESFFKTAQNETYSALVKYELIIDETGKIVSLREAEIKNVEVQRLQPDSAIQNEQQQPLTEPSAVQGTDKVYDFSLVDVVPEFPGGQRELTKYLTTTLKYPVVAKQNNVQGKVYLSFIVEKDGLLSDIKVKQGIGSGCDEEAVRLLRNSPKWKAGLVKDQPVRTYFVLPVSFQSN